MHILASKLLLYVLSATLVFSASGCTNLPEGGYSSRVVFIYDGDTVKLANGERVRYLGIDTPEMNYRKPPAEFFAQEAKDFNAGLVHGKEVWLEFDVVKRDKYNRLLAYVYIDGVFVNARLVEEGYARVYIIPPNVKHADDFLELQRKAKQAKKGIWK